MNKEELIGFDDYKSIYSKPFELNLDYIRSQCHFMDKEDIYKWILSDEIRIINLKQALIDINSSLKRMWNKILGDEKEDELSLKYFTCIDEINDIIDKVLGDEK